MTTTEAGRLTAATFLYRLYDNSDQLLYIGITIDIQTRMGDHKVVKGWWHEVARVEAEGHPTRAAAEAAETLAIRREMPRYNVLKQASGVINVDALPRQSVPVDLRTRGQDRAQAKVAFDQATAALRAEVCKAAAEGMPEAEITRQAGVDRMTVRKWVGKR